MPHLWRVEAGHRYARLRVRDVGRVSIPLSGCLSDADADARSALIARCVEQLVAAGAGASAKRLCAPLGQATSAAELEEARSSIARAIEGARGEGPSARGPTVREFAERWLSGELARLHPDHVRAVDHTENEGRFERYIFPVIGARPIADLGLEDGERVMAAIPSEKQTGTRRHIAQLVRRIAALAQYPAKLITRNPFPPGWLPKAGKEKARSYVYPDEDAKLLACLAIPLWRRLLWGFLAREGTRGPSEALRFLWRHVDLARGGVRLDVNKTEDPRVWSLGPGVAKALAAWRGCSAAAGPNDRIFVDERGNAPTGLPDRLRRDLALALGDSLRPELFERSDHRLRLRAHDLRASFITAALANGKTETWVTDRTGHTSSGQLRRYRRAARTFAELELGDWTPLDEAIPELRAKG